MSFVYRVSICKVVCKMTLQLFLSKRIVTENDIIDGGILVKNEVIEKILTKEEANVLKAKCEGDIKIVNCSDFAILPGVVDSHVHVNEPGRTAWEGFRTATEAAAAGGITTIVDMPLNAIPPTTTLENLMVKAEAAKNNVFVDVGFWGGVIPGNQNSLKELVEAGVVGFKCFLCPSGVDEFPMVEKADLAKAFEALTGTGTVLAFHAEVESEYDGKTKKKIKKRDPEEYKTYLHSRPAKMELEAIDLITSFLDKTDVRVHVVHVSSSEVVPLLEKARNDRIKDGNPSWRGGVTAETCHHYLSLSADQIPRGRSEYKCAPPIRDNRNKERLWQYLLDDKLDLVVSDHSPCTPELKCTNNLEAWGGISSVQFGLSLFWTQASRRDLDLKYICKYLCSGPAHLCGLDKRKGALKPGLDADFVVFDPESTFSVTTEMIRHKNKLTPYLNKELKGVVKQTYLRGTLIYSEDKIKEDPTGNLLLKNMKSGGWCRGIFLSSKPIGRQLFLSRHVVTESCEFDGGVLVDEEGIIEAVLSKPSVDTLLAGNAQRFTIIDGGELALMAGVVDSHVHVNEPGRTSWEGFRTATQAAAYGGVTTIMVMPLNSIPPTVSEENLKIKAAMAREEVYVDVGFWGGVVPGNEIELQDLIRAGVVGFKGFLINSGVSEFPNISPTDIEKVFAVLNGTGTVMAFHSEMEVPNRNCSEETCSNPELYSTYLASRPDEMELNAVSLIASYIPKTDVHVHIVHVSAEGVILILEKAREERARAGNTAWRAGITAETCNHYLTLCAEDIPHGRTEFKCSPPVRNNKNKQKLWEYIRDKRLDVIVSDHSPSVQELKGTDFMKAWGGIASMQFDLPLFWTEARARGLSLSTVSHYLSAGPARLCGLQEKKGSIRPGLDADLIFFDPNSSFVVTPEVIHYKNKISPYMNRVLQGRVIETYLRGQLIFSDNELVGAPKGKLLLNDGY